jgi:hypothetical protein
VVDGDFWVDPWMWMDKMGKKAELLVLVTIHGGKRVTRVSLRVSEYLLLPEEASRPRAAAKLRQLWLSFINHPGRQIRCCRIECVTLVQGATHPLVDVLTRRPSGLGFTPSAFFPFLKW